MTLGGTETPGTETAEPLVRVRNPYELATMAGDRLNRDGGDEEARRMYGQALASLKLLEANRRSLVPWTSRARRFAANLRALEERTPSGGAVVRAATEGLGRYELHQAVDGNYQIRDTTQALWNGWLGGQRGQLSNHKATEQLWVYDPQGTPMPAPILFDSIGLGWLFLHVLKATEQAFLNYRCAVYVLERDPLMLAMAMHVHDLQEAFRSPRVRWFVGTRDEEVMGSLERGLVEHHDWTLPDGFVRSNLRPLPRLGMEEVIHRIHEDRLKQREEWTVEGKNYYHTKDLAYWRERFGAAVWGSRETEPLRILGITSRYTTVLQYSMAELQQAAAEWRGNGGTRAEMRIAIEADDQSAENPLIEMIATFKPDLIVQISRMRYESGELPRNVPFLCWDQDSLPCMRTTAATASLDPLTYVAGHGAVYGHTNLRWPKANCIFCHPAGATFRYNDRPIDAAAQARYACDISYISNASGTPEELAAHLVKRWNHAVCLAMFREAAGVIRAGSDSGSTWDYVRILHLLKSMGGDVTLSPAHLQELTLSLCTYADRCFRHGALAWVSRWCRSEGKTLRLYGRGWGEHPEFNQWAAGPAQPGEEVRAIYQASVINLQMIESGFIHSRSLDGLAAGGFFLARRTPADGLDSPETATLHELGRWVERHGIADDQELDAVEEVGIREKVAECRAYFHRHEVFEPLVPSLHVWANVPPARVLFPQLDAITFRDERSFGELASRYIENAGLRRAVAGEMQEIVRRELSYAARWRLFLDGIAHGLSSTAGVGASSVKASV